MRREPVVYINAFTMLVVGLLTLAGAFGLNVSAETQEKIVTGGAAVIGALAIVTPLVRQAVYSPASVEKIEAGAQPQVVDAPPVERVGLVQ